MASGAFGKLTIIAKDGVSEFEFPLDKKSVLMGRDSKCDIRVLNKEISRKHAEIYVEEEGSCAKVFVNSMGREPVSLNGEPVLSPTELTTGDKIEIQLDGRTRVFYFHAKDSTAAATRAPLAQVNSPPRPVAIKQDIPVQPQAPVAGAPAQEERSTIHETSETVKAVPPPPPPLPPKATPGVVPAAVEAPAVESVQQKVEAPAPPCAGAAFVPSAADLLALKASLRKTAPEPDVPAEETNQAEAQEEPVAMEEDGPQEEAILEPAVGVEPQEVAAPEPDAPFGGPEMDMTMVLEFPEEGGHTQEVVASLVQQAIDAAVQSTAIPQAQAPGTLEKQVPTTAQKARKSVRFNATPEGAPRDATVTFRFRSGGVGDQAVLIEDDTMALADWALGTMAHEDEDQEMPDTVVSKRSRRESLAPSLPGSILRITPARSARKTPLAAGDAPRATPLPMPSSAAKGVTPAGPGARAPACTPLTAAKGHGVAGVGPMDATALAAKLAELAEEHDVTFDLPADFMRFTPLPVSKKSAASATKGATPAPVGAEAPASTPMTAARAAGVAMSSAGAGPMDAASLTAKLAELAEEHDVTFDLPADFMRFTPLPGSKKTISVTVTPRAVGTGGPRSAAKSAPRTAGRSRLGQVVADEPAGTEEVQQPQNPGEIVDQLAAALEAAASAPKSSQGRKSRRSSARTPGTKVAIIGRSTQQDGAPSSVKPTRTARSVPGTTEVEGTESVDAIMQDGGHAAADGEATGMGSDNVPPTVGHLSERDGDTQEVESDVPEEEVSGESEAASEGGDAGAAPQGAASRLELHRAILRAKVYRTQCLQLAKQARSSTARALRLKRAAASLASALAEERAKRQELQAALQQIVANKEAQEEADALEADAMAGGEPTTEEGIEEAEDMDAMDVEVEGPVEDSMPQRRVVVVGYSPAPQPQCTEMAGRVVVVRPAAAGAAGVSPAKTPGRRSLPKTPATGVKSARKTPATTKIRPSVRRTPGTKGAPVVVDDVEVPGWVFEGEAAAPADLSAELAEVAAADEEEAQEAAALRVMQQAAAEVVEDDVSDDEECEEEDGDDQCHVCNEGEEGDVLLLCDSCDNACHLSCCDPPLKRVPKGNWYCTECTAKKTAAKKVPAAKAKKAAEPKKAPAKAAPARGGKKAAAAPPTAGTKRGRGAAAVEGPLSENVPAAKKTKAAAKEAPAPLKRGARQEASPAETPKRAGRTRR